jgi:hypothetical protein
MACIQIAHNVSRLAAGRQNKELFRLSPTTNPFLFMGEASTLQAGSKPSVG